MKKLLAVLLAATFAVPASAAVIDFEDQPAGACQTNGTPSLTSQGFSFTSNDIYAATCDNGSWSTNPTRTFAALYGTGGFSFSRTDGETFSLQSMSAGAFRSPYWNVYGQATGLEVTGHASDGSTATATFSLIGDAFSSFQFTGGFDNLTSVSVLTLGNVSEPGYLFSHIDDIVVDAPVDDVPEPAMLGLFGLGLAGLATRRRRPRS